MPLVKEAKFAKTFVCLHPQLVCFSIPTCETTLHVSVSQRLRDGCYKKQDLRPVFVFEITKTKTP